MLRGDTIRMAGDLALVKSKLVEMRERNLKMLHEMRYVEPRSFPPEIAARAKEIL